MCRACAYVGTKASMTKHQTECAVRQPHGEPGREVYRLRVSGSDRPEYWLDVDLPVGATLDDLDGFLRGIWLDCCGHLSEFTVGPQTDYDADPFRPPKRGKQKQPSLDSLGLTVGQKFGYTYDFGSSTDLSLQVQAREQVWGSGEKVRLLARNLPPALTCSKCEAPARWAHSWEYDEDTGEPLLYCGRHGKSTRDEQLPVVNSPRMGVCGYEGGNLEGWPPGVK
jgi:hypothetical protein